MAEALLDKIDDTAILDVTNIAKLIADPSRVKILSLVEPGTLTVGEIANEMEQAQPAISHHIALLRVAGLIVSTRDGKHHLYRLTKTGKTLAKVVRTLGAMAAN
jgi:DNA-binding transcriptional ArsR family regulator